MKILIKTLYICIYLPCVNKKNDGHMRFSGKLLLILVGLAMFIIGSIPARAAFRLEHRITKIKHINQEDEDRKPSVFTRVKTKIIQFVRSHDDHFHKFEYKKRVGLAAVLSFPYSGGLLGMGRLYMDYNWQFLVQCGVFAATFFILLGYLFNPKSILINALLPLFVSALLFCVIWEIVDMVRVLNGSLMPKWGGWR